MICSVRIKVLSNSKISLRKTFDLYLFLKQKGSIYVKKLFFTEKTVLGVIINDTHTINCALIWTIIQ